MTKKISTFILLGLILTVVVWMFDKESLVTVDWTVYHTALSLPELMLIVILLVTILDFVNTLFRKMLKLQVNKVYETSLLGNHDGYEDESIDVLAGKIGEKIIIDRKDFDASLLLVLRTMTAITAGDMAEAKANLKRLKQVIGDDPILDVLMMKIYKGEKNFDKMEKLSEKIMKNADIQIVGMKAAVEAQMEKREFQVALKTANRAFELRQDLYWIIESAFELRAKAGDWEGAMQVLDAGKKKKIVPLAKYNHLKAMVLFERAKQAKAANDEVNYFKFCSQSIESDDTFTPAFVEIAKYYKANDNQIRKAEGALLHAWKKNPVDEIAYEYLNLFPKDSAKEKVIKIEKLANFNGVRPSLNNRLTAEFSAKGNLWGKAKSEIELFLINNPATKKICEIVIDYETKVEKDKKEAKLWKSRYEDCAEDSLWVCSNCGTATEHWHTVCPHCAAFGQQEWHLYVEQSKKNTIVQDLDDDNDEDED